MIQQLVINAIKKNIINRYSEFSSTISRSEFWKFILVEAFLFGICVAILGLLSLNSALYMYMMALFFAICTVSIMSLTLPNLGAIICRFRDTNTSAWLLLLVLIPYIGILIVIALLLRDSKASSIDESQSVTQEEMNLVDDSYESMEPQVVDSVVVTNQAYGKKTIIMTALVTVLCWSVGLYSFSSATTKEARAYLKMEPGAFMTLAIKDLGSDTAIPSAQQVVTDYYAYLNKEQYQEAYRLLAHREREKYGTYEQWVKSVKASHSREMRRIFLDGVYVDDDGFKHIYFDMAFKGEEYPGRMAVYMVYEHETWRIESIAPYHKE